MILVQPLLGLKGNVEMTLASRLSTHANLGDMDTKTGLRRIILGNMSLVQCQAATVGFIAPVIALLLSFVSAEHSHDLTLQEVILLGASSVITANVANLLLGSVMCGVVILSRKWNINPDNIATPIAASLGDFTTMILLANISQYLYTTLANPWLQDTLLTVLLILIPVWAIIARRNPHTSTVIVTGWFPICGAMLIQNGGGLIMERALNQFRRIAAFQPVINGVGGNLVAIQSSRMSTHLHKYSKRGELPESESSPCLTPCNVFCGTKSPHSVMARLLLGLAGPSHIFFLLVTRLVNKNFYFTPAFLCIYLAVALIQVTILLNLAYCLVHWMWKKGINPDNSAIPFLTALADLIGSALLAAAFVLLLELQDENAFSEITSNPRITSNLVSNITQIYPNVTQLYSNGTSF
jgi:solute carrier family 41